MQRLVYVLHAIEIRIRNRPVEDDRSDRNRKVMRENAQERPPRLGVQSFERAQYPLNIKGLSGDDRSVGIFHRRPVKRLRHSISLVTGFHYTAPAANR